MLADAVTNDQNVIFEIYAITCIKRVQRCNTYNGLQPTFAFVHCHLSLYMVYINMKSQRVFVKGIRRFDDSILFVNKF